MRDFRESAVAPHTPILLLANKTDGKRVVSAAAGRAFASQNNMLYEEVSVRKAQNVTGAMMRLVDAVYAEFIIKGRYCPGIRTHDHSRALLPRHVQGGGSSGGSRTFGECCVVS